VASIVILLLAFLTSWVGTATFCVVIAAIFGVAWSQIGFKLRLVRERNKELSLRLSEMTEEARGSERDQYRLAIEVREEMDAAVESGSSIRLRALVSRYEAEAARLDGAVAFWVDLLRQLGLLGTVMGIGFALLADPGELDLLRPLALAVWTTVTGLTLSIVLAARFSDVEVDADNCRRYVEQWAARLGEQRVPA
jgi:hypothetical protein